MSRVQGKHHQVTCQHNYLIIPQNILLQSPQGVKYCVNCEEAEKVPSAQQCQVNSNQVVNPGLRPDVPKVNLEQVECVLLTKLHAAASVLQETNSTDITIHHCHVITACSEAILAVRKLSATATPPINAHQ